MFAEIHYPARLAPHELDIYLEHGWFRMGQAIFTTHFVHFNNRFYSALWLRMKLDEFTGGRTQEKLFRRNAGFQVSIGPATLTPEKEALYAVYKQTLPFEPSASLRQLLFGKGALRPIYNTYEVTLHNGDQLIAVGFFDLGANSAAGIASIYDPAYKKYSPGKYLIYRKLDYCKKQNLRYFYPGYFVPGYPAFDYKLKIGKDALQFLSLHSRQWLSIESFSPEHIPIQVMRNKLDALQQLLAGSTLKSKVLHYEFFDANLIPDLKDSGLFDYPAILFFPSPMKEDLNPIVVFDVRDGQYHLFKCFPVWKPDVPTDDPGIYAEYIVKVEQEVFVSARVGEMAGKIISLVNG